MVTHVAGKKALLTSAVKCKRWLRYYIRLLHNVVMRYTTARATTGAPEQNFLGSPIEVLRELRRTILDSENQMFLVLVAYSDL